MKPSPSSTDATDGAGRDRCAAPRTAPASIVRAIVGGLALVGFAAIVVIVANAREPYGGPLEA